MSDRVLRLGVAGLGRAFTLMLPTFTGDPRVVLCGAADPRAEARARFASDFSAPTYATVAELCDRLGVAFDDASQQAVQRWIDDHPQDKHGVHRYTAADFGLDPDRLRARFDFYARRFL